MNRKILMIVNEFPPVAESGVQRPLKFAKYLAKDGWEPHIITPRSLPKITRDESLINEVPLQAKIYKTFSLGIRAKMESNLTEYRSDFTKSTNFFKNVFWLFLKLFNDIIFPLDKQIGWVPFAAIKAIQVIRRNHIRNVYITAFPYSAFLIGIILKVFFKGKILWVADYRDAWQFAPMLRSNVLTFRFWFICMMDGLVLRTSDHIVFTSPYVMEQYRVKYEWLYAKSSVITNGYDEDDFTGVEPMMFDKFTFAYMGKIYTEKRDPTSLLNAIKQTMNCEYQYLHVGTIGKQILKKIHDKGYKFYKYIGYKQHSEAISYAFGADINVMINNNDVYSEGTVPGKLFELLRVGKPILAVGPHQSFIKDFLEKYKIGHYVKDYDETEIAKGLEILLNPDYKSTLTINDIIEFSREKLTAKLEAIFESN